MVKPGFNCRVLSLNLFKAKKLFLVVLRIYGVGIVFFKGNVVKAGFKWAVLSLNVHEPKESFQLYSTYMELKPFIA